MIVVTIGTTVYGIDPTPECWELRKRVTRQKTGAVEWSSPIGYYTRLESLADKLARLGATNAAGSELRAISAVSEALRGLLGDKPPPPTWQV